MPASQDRVVLYIDRSSSECGACGGAAAPEEKQHIAPIGYRPKPGCGATYTHVSSHYAGRGIKEAAQEMRPDLIPDFLELP